MANSRQSPDLSSAAEIQISWILLTGASKGVYFYTSIGNSVEWLAKPRKLRFTVTCLVGDDEDFEMELEVGESTVLARFDSEDESARSRSLNWFEGPSGIVLDYRTRTELLSILIR